jgi:hypothetical protein
MYMKKKGTLPTVMLAAAMLGGCGKDDGVPKVDIHGTIIVTGKANGWTSLVPKKRMITLPDGSQISLGEFLLTYCIGKETTNATCARGMRIDAVDSGDPQEKLPAGL